MKTLDNKTWYVLDLDNYNEEFLKEIIIDLTQQIELLKGEKL